MDNFMNWLLGPLDRFDARPYKGGGSIAQEIGFLAVIVLLCIITHEFYSNVPLVRLLIRAFAA